MAEEQSTEELRALQLQKEVAEVGQARTAPDESETAQHQRRAEKARYLREKLEEREESERETAEDDRPPAG